MRLPSHKILKFITKNREVSLADLMPLIEKRFNDYRDYYPLSQLCISGYIKCSFEHKNGPHTEEKLLASILYSCATGVKKVNNFTSSRSKPTPDLDMFHSTTKGELYFAEALAKRSDRIYSMAVGIVVGISTAVLAVKLGIR